MTALIWFKNTNSYSPKKKNQDIKLNLFQNLINVRPTLLLKVISNGTCNLQCTAISKRK